MLHGAGPAGGWWSSIRFNREQAQPHVTRDLLGRVAAYARPYTTGIMVMLVSILASSLMGLVPPLLYRELIDHALPQRDLARLNIVVLGMVAIPVIDGLNGVGQRWLTSRIGEGIIADLRKALYAHMQRMSLRFFTNTKTGELMSWLNNDVVGAQRAVTSTLVSIITSAFQVVATLAIMISLDWRLTLVSVVILPLFVLPMPRMARLFREIINQQLDLNAQMNAQMNETLNVICGALLVKLFGRQRDETARFGERAERVRDIGVRQAMVGRWFFMLLGLVGTAGTAIVWLAGGYLVVQGSFTIGTIVAFAAYLTQLYTPVSTLINARVDFATSMVSFERVFAMLDLPVELEDRPGALELARVRGDVHFENVTFSYLESERADEPGSDGEGPLPVAVFDSDGERPAAATSVVARPDGNGHKVQPPRLVPTRRYALRSVDFEIKAGQLAALVGPSGAGKTTITYLIPRLYDPTEGRVLVDGHDLRDVTLDSLSRQIGMVTQETYLVHDTVRANLLYAKPTATQEEIERAARAANIHDFIAKLPQQYETIVGERGYRLSGGEKQRVAIARVILKDPRILVLDEATSSLDSESEALIQDALKPLMKGRTNVVIAHRLSTILAADVILVIEEGRVVERGTHSQLLEQNGLYARLYHTQFRDQLALAE
ncbi:MAG: ABC transporter ATP-binding protein/permease [Chloroflexi bacterium]|nr:ABC transporter ATP-binding protein/permease [Chloroflexota bacterium]